MAKSFLPEGQKIRVVWSWVKRAPSREQYLGLFTSTSIFVKEEQPLNAPAPILVTLEGIEKFCFPAGQRIRIVWSLVKRAPSREQYFGLFLSTSIFVKEEQLENAPAPILVTLEGIEKFCFPAGQRIRVVWSWVKSAPSMEQYSGLALSTSIFVKEEQPENAWSPMLVTLEGITTDDKEEQPENAQSPTLVTLEGITTDDKEEQS